MWWLLLKSKVTVLSQSHILLTLPTSPEILKKVQKDGIFSEELVAMVTY